VGFHGKINIWSKEISVALSGPPVR